MAYRESTEGVIAVAEYQSLKLEDLQLPEHPLILVLERVEKPGRSSFTLNNEYWQEQQQGDK